MYFSTPIELNLAPVSDSPWVYQDVFFATAFSLHPGGEATELVLSSLPLLCLCLHHSSSVLAIAWHTSGDFLLSGEKSKRCIVWRENQ